MINKISCGLDKIEDGYNKPPDCMKKWKSGM